MVPSGIKRDGKKPFRTRRLENGTIVVEDAYEGRYTFAAEKAVNTEIKGLRTNTSGDQRPPTK